MIDISRVSDKGISENGKRPPDQSQLTGSSTAICISFPRVFDSRSINGYCGTQVYLPRIDYQVSVRGSTVRKAFHRRQIPQTRPPPTVDLPPEPVR